MVAENQKGKLLALAKDIVAYGLNPGDPPYVIPLKGDKNRYVVIEGNRRLVALRALENPDSFRGVLDEGTLRPLRALSKKYLEDPIDLIDCLVFKDKDDARHWIELRHIGESEGAGIVRWGTDEKARYLKRNDDLAVQALDFLQDHSYITSEYRAKVKVTNFRRVLNTPEFRAKVGVGVENGQLSILGSTEKVAEALLYVLNDIAIDHDGSKKETVKKNVKHIYTKPQRLAYANSLPAAIVVKPLKNGVASSKGKASTAKKKTPPRPAHKRDKLIPRDCVLAITDPRIGDIEEELRSLSLQEHPNAVSVLFRVFMELSADCVARRSKLTITEHAKLRDKIEAIVKDLLSRKKLTAQEARPVNRACQRGSFLAPSIDLLHDYIHNQHVFPAPGDLRAHWDSLQPFFIAMWPP